jgi:Zn-dependent protease
MRSSIRLGKLFGIEIGLHYSWFLIALLIVMSLASQFRESHAEWGSNVIWALSVLTALLFFVTLLAHEMSHALVARTRGLTTQAITLFALGGVAQIEKEPEDAKTEFLVGIVGPLSSAVIGVVLLGVAWAIGWRIGASPATPLLAMLVWLGYINLTLAAFNMIPGYPLDGNMNVELFVEQYFLRSGKRCFVVQQNGEMAGLVTSHEIKDLERPRWPYTTLSDIMRPLDQLHTVAPNTPVMEALETMGRDDVNQLPVVSGNHLDGIITRANVVQFLHTRAELGR